MYTKFKKVLYSLC